MFSHEVNTECDINSDFFEWQWKRWTFPVSSQLSHHNRWQQCHFAKPHICWTFKFFPLQLYISTFSVLFCEDTVHISWLGLGTKISSSCKKEYIYMVGCHKHGWKYSEAKISCALTFTCFVIMICDMWRDTRNVNMVGRQWFAEI